MGILEDVMETGQPLRIVAPEATVLAAVNEMCRWHVRAVIVGSAADPVGILCESDVLQRVVRPGLDPATTPVASVMTAPVVCLPARATPEEALTYMRERRLHQAPVTSDEALIGVVSASDLRRWTLARREIEVAALTCYVMTGG
jgi:CBS domain-containing protein